jgi:hypothetical protein
MDILLYLRMISEPLGSWILSIIRYCKELENITFRKLFPSSSDGEAPTFLSPLERDDAVIEVSSF